MYALQRLLLLAFTCFSFPFFSLAQAPDESQYPDPDEFVQVEQEPKVDLADLQKKVVYPDMAIRANIQGRVIVQVLIDKEGNPVRTLIMSSESTLLNKAAVDAVMASKFKPAIQKGMPISCWISIPVTFKLRGSNTNTGSGSDITTDILRLTRLVMTDKANRAEHLYERGKLYYQSGDYQLAQLDYLAANIKKETYEQVFLKRVTREITDSTKAQAWIERAQLYEKNYLPGKAIEDYTRAITIDPQFYTIYKQRAENHMRLKQYSPAVIDLKAFLKSDPGNIPAHEQLARAYVKLGKTEQAGQYLEKAIKGNPASAALQYLLALSHLTANDFDNAKIIYIGANAMPQPETTRYEALRDLRDLFQNSAKSNDVQRIIKEVFQL